MTKKVIAVVVLILVVIAIVVSVFFAFKKSSKLSVKPKKPVVHYFDPVDGLEVSKDLVDRKPLAIMIENFSGVRPQSGLRRASMVFEALAEGGITRFLTIFTHNEAEVVGPIRSARPYYVNLAAGFAPVYVHAGGSPLGIQTIKDLHLDDLDYSIEEAFYRDKSRFAPHNLFSSTQKLRSVAYSKLHYSQTSDYKGFFHQKTKPPKTPKKQQVEIDFSYKDYKVMYTYDYKSNSYLRFNAGLPHKDALTNKQIAPKNVVIMKAATSMYDPKTLNISVIGSGEAIVIENGQAINGTWQKDDAFSQIIFKDIKGKVISLNPGQTWVEVVKPETPVLFKETMDSKTGH